MIRRWTHALLWSCTVAVAAIPLPSPAGVIPTGTWSPSNATLYVVAVGINGYEDTPLEYAEADAEAFASAMENIGTSLFSRVDKQLLTAGRTTRGAISMGFQHVIDRSTPADVLVFYFAGSSVTTNDREFFLLPSDTSSDSSTAVRRATAVSSQTLATWCQQVQAQRQMFILDTCRSTKAFMAFTSDIAGDKDEDRQLLRRSVVIVGVEGLTGEDPTLGHSLFNEMLRRGLAGEADAAAQADSIVTAWELSAYVMNRPVDSKRSGFVRSLSVGGDFPLGAADRLALRGLRLADPIASPDPDVPQPADPIPDGRDYALLIATNDYDSWDDLANPTVDARAIADELRGPFQFEDVELLEDVPRTKIYETLRKKYRLMNFSDNDQLLIFVAGHGWFDPETREGYIVAKDSKKNDEYGESYIPYGKLRTIVDNIPCRHILLVLDVCFGGTFDEQVASLRGNPDEELPAVDWIRERMKFKTRRFITSSGKEYVSDGRPGHHSPFAGRFLDALRSYGGHDHILNITAILKQVERLKPEPLEGWFGSNEPGSDFFFVAVPESQR